MPPISGTEVAVSASMSSVSGSGLVDGLRVERDEPQLRVAKSRAGAAAGENFDLDRLAFSPLSFLEDDSNGLRILEQRKRARRAHLAVQLGCRGTHFAFSHSVQLGCQFSHLCFHVNLK